MATVELKGGEALAKKLKELADKLGDGGTLRVGFIEGATYPDGTPVALVAAANEFGRPDKNQPPRPFFRGMIAEKSKAWPKAIGALAKNNDYDIDRTLGQMGDGIKGQLQASIQKLDSPPLAPSTVKRKGFAKPLVDTGHMLNSVDYEVDT
ncbi:hypothetical protein LWS69_01245 [Bordetella hinzii]|uniref:hypothetical protein n=1 Tax=Bordetella hinzii TaxID=103855 RepID=UPI00045A4640|nr:hypothetical protein [Bordetella hinzii]KCB33744.1 hypothetical protein L541_4878 [Bordetella hinzii CA90 BAL1384]MCJ9707658.1 hypothetical protein [Bordetella hinzii]QDJ35836.1 hypothetical protein CBR67_03755 [Bordetella hinzii]QDJ44806.1 hypothetical protein CBR71_02770 [Bordetella hinzii]